jgi:Cof subfamily protein (haloacid dehalogenase superfamily)
MTEPLSRLSLLFTDLDGTLLARDESVASPVVNQLRSARARGVAIVPATARGITSVRSIAQRTGLGPIAVCANGAVGYHLERDIVLWVRALPSGFVRFAVERLLNQDDGFYFAVSSTTQFWPQHDFLSSPTSTQQAYDLTELYAVDPAIRLICRHRDAHADELIETLGGLLSGVQLISGSTDWVEILPKGVNKGFGVGLAAEILGVALEDCVAVGDHLNDLPMLRSVGHPFTVKNAHSAILATGATLVASNEEGGVGELAARMGYQEGW